MNADSKTSAINNQLYWFDMYAQMTEKLSGIGGLDELVSTTAFSKPSGSSTSTVTDVPSTNVKLNATTSLPDGSLTKDSKYVVKNGKWVLYQ
jgi:hypothetical protein